MTTWVRRAAALVIATALGLLVPLAGTAAPAATAAPPAAPCGIGEARGKGVAPSNGSPVAFDFSVCEEGPLATDTTGRFARDASGRRDPVRCADLNERTMAFLYALDDGAPVADRGKQVLVVVTDGGPRPADDRIAFTEPRSASAFPDGCGLGSRPAQELTQRWQPLSEGEITVTLNR